MSTKFNLEVVLRMGLSKSERLKAVNIFNSIAEHAGFKVTKCRMLDTDSEINATYEQFRNILNKTYMRLRGDQIKRDAEARAKAGY